MLTHSSTTESYLRPPASAMAVLRGLDSRDLGRLAYRLLPPALEGCAGPKTLLALRGIGVALTEREGDAP